MLKRRSFLWQAAAVLTVGPAIVRAEKAPLIQVYKSPTCSCCSKWADHMRDAGFEVSSTDVRDVNLYKLEYAVPAQLRSCHTAIVNGYVVEGHVPADDVIRMLRDKPASKGLAVPGMPIGSPGMEGANPVRYETLSFDATGETAVFAVHGPE
jgi:hypothetical protein